MKITAFIGDNGLDTQKQINFLSSYPMQLDSIHDRVDNRSQ